MTIARLAGGVGTGLIFYNGFTFSPAAETRGLSVTPQYDSSGRTVKASLYRWEIHDYIETTDFTVIALGPEFKTPTVLAKLCAPAGAFRYRGRGFGSIEVNTGKDVWDVAWGPKPRLSDWKVKGGNGNVPIIEFTWVVEVMMPNCPDAMFRAGPNAFLEFNFSVNYDIDKSGYTTRRTDAHLTIPQTRRRVDARTLESHADLFRAELVDRTTGRLPPRGFWRDSQSYDLSEDKCTIKLSAVDKQHPPNLPPLGAVEAKAEHTYQSIGLARWTGTLSAEYELAREPDDAVRRRSVAGLILAYQDLLFERTSAAANMTIGRGLPDGVKLPKIVLPRRAGKVVIIPHAASASEVDVYGRTRVRISSSYLACGVGLVEILEHGGLWRRPGFVRTNPPWETWVASVYGTPGLSGAWGARGHAQLAFGLNQDRITDLCRPGAPPGPSGPPGPLSNLLVPQSSLGQPNAPPGLLSELSAALRRQFPPPDQQGSWIEFRADVTVRADTGAVVGRTLPAAPLTRSSSKQATWDAYAGLPSADAGQSSFPPLSDLLRESQTAGDVFYQQRCKPAIYLTFSGVALRAGWSIPMPEVLEINGSRPALIGEPWFKTSVVSNAVYPIVAAGWSQTYVFDDAGGGAPARAVPPVPAALT